MRPLPSEDARDQVRSRLNLVEVVQQHVRLRKQGRELWGLCPFHQEHTPSFHVNEQKQSWYCFSCQKGGDLFTFVELIEKTDFPGALRILAEQAGVELPERGGAAQERAQLRRRLVELNRLAVQYYEYVLRSIPAGQPGRDLLERRQVGEDTARRFGLGYAPGGASFTTFLRKRGHSISDAVAAGLVRRGGQDFFQQRLVVPIRDERGQPLAFTGRTVREDEPRKYVNTPETPAYVKGRVLFGLDQARDGMGERGQARLGGHGAGRDRRAEPAQPGRWGGGRPEDPGRARPDPRSRGAEHLRRGGRPPVRHGAAAAAGRAAAVRPPAEAAGRGVRAGTGWFGGVSSREQTHKPCPLPPAGARRSPGGGRTGSRYPRSGRSPGRRPCRVRPHGERSPTRWAECARHGAGGVPG